MPNFTYSWFFRTAAILLVSSCLSVFTFRLPTRPWSLHTAAPNRHKILQRHAAGRYEVSSTDFDGEKALPRLNPNTKKLFDWINRCGGATDGAVIMKANDGWSLAAEDFLDINETIVSIPKMICIYADPDLMEYPLLENTQLLMQSLGMRQWRARLAIALLSERTKAGTFFAPYLMNLPWEFNGMPIFFKADEVE